MEAKELKIQIPDGYEIDKDKSTFEKIIFKLKNTKPKSWKEYCEQQSANNKTGYFIDEINCDLNEICWHKCSKVDNWKNILPSKELAEEFLAMMQLMSLRQAWIEGWNSNQFGYAIMLDVKRDIMVSHAVYPRALTFPDKNMAVDFMNYFKDLLEIAKPLI